jgi:C4-dicarboxylate transporter DctM subunit
MTPGAIGLAGMAALIVLIFLRVPVGVAMGLVGFFGYAAIDGWGRALSVLGQAPFDVATGYTLTVVPLFIVMGDLALRAGMSAKLYDASRSLFFGMYSRRSGLCDHRRLRRFRRHLRIFACNGRDNDAYRCPPNA